MMNPLVHVLFALGLPMSFAFLTTRVNTHLVKSQRTLTPKISGTASALQQQSYRSLRGKADGGDDEYVFTPLEQLVKGLKDKPAREPWKQPLKNKYIGLRHGQSTANLEGIISSEPSVGTLIHGLTELGQEQAIQSCVDLLQTIKPYEIPDLVFISSDFTRAYETALGCTKQLQQTLLKPEAPFLLSKDIIDSICMVQIRTELRERYFGSFDAKLLIFYNKVWPLDSINADNADGGVESVNQVIDRFCTLLRDLEELYANKVIVLVSHADTLQIIQTYLCSGSVRKIAGTVDDDNLPDASTSLDPVPAAAAAAAADPRRFHEYRFKNGEVRDMSLLPDPVPIEYK